MVELSTKEREDDLFNAFNEDGLHIGEVKVDINLITAQRTGTLETYLLQAEEYLESIRQEREQELTQQIQTQGEMEKEEVEVTLMVSECGEFHNLPHRIQTQSFMMLSKLGILNEQQATKVGNDFFASITMLTFKYLLNGELTKAKKEAFSEEAFTYINRMFRED